MPAWSRCISSAKTVCSMHSYRVARHVSTLARPSIKLLLDTPNAYYESDVTVNGFVQSVRKQKTIAFATVNDGSSLNALQAVLSPDQARDLSNGVAVEINGKLQHSLPGKEQAYELLARSVQVQGHNDIAKYPIQKKYQTPEFLRNFPHLRTRMPFNALLLRLRSQIIADATAFFAHNDFVQAHTPIITSSDCEGAGDVFTIAPNRDTHDSRVVEDGQPPDKGMHFFGRQKYLTVSSQLHLEALAQSIGKVWSLSPTFRAERSDTARHLSEFYMLEAEMAFTDRLDEVMQLVEDLIKFLVTRLRDSKTGNELLVEQANRSQPLPQAVDGSPDSHNLEDRWQKATSMSWPRVTFQEAVHALQDAESNGKVTFEHTPVLNDGLQTEHERYLVDLLGSGSPIFVTDYPKAIKPFYMAESSVSIKTGAGENIPTVSCFDLLMPEVCEVVGGSLREDNLERLMGNMRAKGILNSSRLDELDDTNPEGLSIDGSKQNDTSSLDWYLDLRRYGSVPHGGFGLGFDRLLCFLSGVSNLRDTVTFPRWHSRCIC